MDDSTLPRSPEPKQSRLHEERNWRSRMGPLLAALVAAVLFVGLFLLIDRAWKVQLTERKSAAVTSELASLGAQVESQINGLVHSTIGLAAYAYVHPDLGDTEFERVAERLHRGHEGLMISLTLARGSVIELVYPLEGNEAVVGLDIGAHPEQADSYHRVLQEREPVVAGPWPLVQGGQGILIRAPVYTGPDLDNRPEQTASGAGEHFTITSIALDLDAFLERVGLHDRSEHLHLALRGQDGAGEVGPFFHNPDALDATAPYTHRIRFPGGEWQLLADVGPTQPGTDRPVAWWALGIVGALAVGGYTYRVGTGLRQRRRELDRYRGLVNRLADPTLVVSGRRILWANPAFTRMLGYQRSIDMDLEHLNMVHPDDLYQLPPNLDFTEMNPDTLGREVRIRQADGDYRYFLLRWVPVEWEQGHALLVTFLDVHENRLLFEALAAARDLQDAMFEAVPGDALVIDSEGTIRRVFGDTCRRFASCEPLIGKRLDQLMPSSLAAGFLAVVHRAIEEETLQTHDYYLETDVLKNFGVPVHDGRARWYEGRIRPLACSVSGRPAVVWHALDVTERRELELRLKTMAWEDPLTGMANRAALDRAFPRLAARADRQRGRLALLFIDLDRFKPVNDRFGHAVGDQLLRQIAGRLKSHLRPDDVLVRLGGDEFIVLTAPLDERDEGQHLAERLRQDLDKPFHVQIGDTEVAELQISSSIGVAFYPDAGQQLPEVMVAADRAMYQVKTRGRNGVALADEVPPAGARPANHG
ncbi:diguanylate cyclase [Thioalkalivibrio sp. ARh3]|uniref:sensor domain-containing diguanylate cyclase n=1 Tax=Thioalkalivibrio sp. ARh3 TaxID=1158148 RepID=UPI0004756DA3|nr:diguanylate cyclase [Thioalkalivibrio sp. ARh3]